MGYKNCIKILTELKERSEGKKLNEEDQIILEKIDKELTQFLKKGGAI